MNKYILLVKRDLNRLNIFLTISLCLLYFYFNNNIVFYCSAASLFFYSIMRIIVEDIKDGSIDVFIGFGFNKWLILGVKFVISVILSSSLILVKFLIALL